MSGRTTAAALLSRRNPCHIRTSTATLQYNQLCNKSSAFADSDFQ